MDIRESSYDNQINLKTLKKEFFEENQSSLKFYDLCKKAFHHPNIEIKREIISLLDNNFDDLANHKKISNLFNTCFSELCYEFEKLPSIKFIISLCSNNNRNDLSEFFDLNKRDLKDLNDFSNHLYYNIPSNRMTKIFLKMLSFHEIENPFITIQKKLKSLTELAYSHPYHLLILSDIFKTTSLKKTCVKIINSNFNCKIVLKNKPIRMFFIKKTNLLINLKNNSKIDLETFEKFIRIANKNFHIRISISSSINCSKNVNFNINKIVNFIESFETKYIKTLKIYGYGIFPSFDFEKLTKLKKLTCNIQHNSIPKEIGTFKYLKTLSITNSLLKSIPSEIGLLTNLIKLSINHCNNIQSIPSEIGSLVNLQTLELKSNSNLTFIPWEIQNLISLENLNLTGSIKLQPLSILNIILGFGWDKINEMCPSICYDSILKISSTIFVENVSPSYLDVKKNILYDDSELDYNQLNNYSAGFAAFLIEDIVSRLIFLNIKATDLNNNNHPEILTFENLYIFLCSTEILQENCSQAIDFIKNMPLTTETLYKFHSKFLSKSLKNFREYLCKKNNIYLNELNWKNILHLYFKSSNDHFDYLFLESKSVQEILLTLTGKDVLIKCRDAIFQNHPVICNFIYENYPAHLQENIELYPIEVSYKEDLMEANVICFQSDLEDCKKIFVFLHLFNAIVPYTPWKLFVRYRNQRGIDQGALSIDFVSNLFKTLSKKWKLYKGIPSKYIPEFKELGRIFSFVYANSEYVLGSVLNEDFYKTIVRFSYRQLTSRIDDLTERELLKIAKGYLNEVKYTHLKNTLSLLTDKTSFTIQNVCDLHNVHNFENIPTEICDMHGNIIPEILINWIQYDLERIPLLQSIIKKELFDEIRMQLEMLQNLFQIGVSEEEWIQITREGYKELMISFEGMFDRQFLIDCIYFKNINPEVEETILEWLNNISEEQLKKFTALVTGSSHLSIRSIIKIVGYKPILNNEDEIDISRNKIYVQGCFSKIKIPTCLTDKESIQAAFYQITEGEKDFSMS